MKFLMARTTTLGDTPKATASVEALGAVAWPTFLHHGDIRNWSRLFEQFARYQVVLVGDSGEVVGVGHTVPIDWDGTVEGLPESIETILQRAVRLHEGGGRATTLSALAIIVAPDHQRQGHSERILQAMRALAVSEGMRSLIAPVRPTLKSEYPLVPFQRYVEWKRDDGLPFDPWLRVHVRLGASPLKIIPEGVVVEGTVKEWESWTGMSFFDSGEYVVPGALQPVAISRTAGMGRYADPNIWMEHAMPTRSASAHTPSA